MAKEIKENRELVQPLHLITELRKCVFLSHDNSPSNTWPFEDCTTGELLRMIGSEEVVYDLLVVLVDAVRENCRLTLDELKYRAHEHLRSDGWADGNNTVEYEMYQFINKNILSMCYVAYMVATEVGKNYILGGFEYLGNNVVLIFLDISRYHIC